MYKLANISGYKIWKEVDSSILNSCLFSLSQPINTDVLTDRTSLLFVFRDKKKNYSKRKIELWKNTQQALECQMWEFLPEGLATFGSRACLLFEDVRFDSAGLFLLWAGDSFSEG